MLRIPPTRIELKHDDGRLEVQAAKRARAAAAAAVAAAAAAAGPAPRAAPSPSPADAAAAMAERLGLPARGAAGRRVT
jgi:hypothetical protein